MIEKIKVIVDRVTFFSEETGRSVLKVQLIDFNKKIVPITVHQAKVFAGATMEFHGEWTRHVKYGSQFKASKVIELKPSSIAALEKYLGSGLISGVGPKTAKRVVNTFGENTLEVFDKNPKRLIEVSGISKKKLIGIIEAWSAHKEIRNVMLFLQGHGISTLYAVKIFKTYGDTSVDLVRENPYRLATDIYGIGFKSADKIALSIGIEESDPIRVQATILHCLNSSKEEGHCFLTYKQIVDGLNKNISLNNIDLIDSLLNTMENSGELFTRVKEDNKVFYSKSLFFDELYVSKKVKELTNRSDKYNDEIKTNIELWLESYNKEQTIPLSNEQISSVAGISQSNFSILTGGPGCGKTTTTKTLVQLLLSMKKNVLLAAPTGRAAQRMGELMGLPAKMIHRLLVFDPSNGGFQYNEDNQLIGDFLIIDECSMLDVSLSAALLKAVPSQTQVLFIGDKDQLPSVGAGNILSDLLATLTVKSFKLTEVFRQAKESLIIKYAHMINLGEIPPIESPVCHPEHWKNGKDALMLDAEEATVSELEMISKIRGIFKKNELSYNDIIIQRKSQNDKNERAEILKKNGDEFLIEDYDPSDLNDDQAIFNIPKKFSHLNLAEIMNSSSPIEDLKSVMKEIHPWSMLHYGFSAKDSILKVYLDSIPKYLGRDLEIQILSPMTKGSMGTHNLNKEIQENKNPSTNSNITIIFGDKEFRTGD